ncbi:interferon-inducible protein AIM2 isoform X1 [Cavia porcellus]|uniref:interferon-inducible protein AIM2 isoform X1 n=1 Tax=Cavia porcellus TaxID=10141 RepID=UPI002FE25465
MENEYKEILLVKGLENLNDEELKKFKFFIPEKLKIAKSRLQPANRTDVAQLMVERLGPVAALREAIKLFKKLNQNEIVKHIEEEKKKVDTKYKKVKNETKAVKKKGHNTEIPGVSTASRSDTIKQPATSKAPSQSKKMKKKDPRLLDSNSSTAVIGKQKTTPDERSKRKQKSSTVTKMGKNLQLKSGTKVTKAKKKK